MTQNIPRGPSRRRLLNWFLGTSFGALVAAACYPVARFLTPPRLAETDTAEIEAGFVDDPDFRDRGFKIVRFGNEPVIVLKLDETSFRAFTATCTHLDCIVDYRKDKRLIWCWCHNGIYDLEGRNIGGPPPRPLTPFAVHLVEGDGGTAKIVVAKT